MTEHDSTMRCTIITNIKVEQRKVLQSLHAHHIDQDLYDAASGRLVLSDLDDINDFFSQSKFSGPFTGNTGSVLVISGLDTDLYRTMK